ncbi:MAG: 5'-nucleotidase C-terminal domain-containing protein [Deltaproteobacteria bacterium]|nr:5'-nucleotidase C-terminal domain-containing protein [Deltaproteobacteria bacterium]
MDAQQDRKAKNAWSWGWRSAAIGLVGLASVATTTGCPAPQDPVQIHGQTHLTLIHTADLHSRLFPYSLQVGQVDAQLGLGSANTVSTIGGAARISHIIGRERARAGRVLHLDGGDCFQGAPIFNFYNGEAEIRALSQLGTDAMVIANHEFDRGALNVANQINLWADFPVLAANYQFDDWRIDGNPELGRVVQPFTTFNLDGLKVAVIGMGNLSTLSSLYETPNKLGIQPLSTVEVTQFYVDLLRPFVDFIVVVTHLGLEVDERMIEGTSGVDVVLGGHNHIVLQPPKTILDCSKWDPQANSHYIELADGQGQSETTVPTKVKRWCVPRPVLLAHSGAFAKFVGRLDLVISDDANDKPVLDPRPELYYGNDPLNKFEVISHGYQLFPVTEDTPEDPRLVALLEQYKAGLDALIDLDLLAGFAPDGSKRTAPNGGDSPLGNLVATAAWLRLGIQTDFSLTNTTGIRADMVPGPVSVEQIFNIFPFDNAISKMQLSGVEVQQLMDFVAKRSAGRGCKSQAQVAGVRAVINCTGCTTHTFSCQSDSDCNGNKCDMTSGICAVQPPCADHIYIGSSSQKCADDAACGLDAKGNVYLGRCDKSNPDGDGNGRCWTPIMPIGSYELATSDYLAGGGSGYQVLKRNTTQINTQVQQRDALIDYVRAQKPCGYKSPKDVGYTSAYDTKEGLMACTQDSDCPTEADYVCACAESSIDGPIQGQCISSGPCGSTGRCVLKACRDGVAAHHRTMCDGAVKPELRKLCEARLGACQAAGETCKYLACIDRRMGNYADNRLNMIGQ